MIEALEQFEFLRPAWLLAFLPLAGLVVAFHHLAARESVHRSGVAAHLLRHLLVEPRERPSVRPADVVLPVATLVILATAGPSWRYEPSPLAEEQSSLMVVLRASRSMTAGDLAPSRLERAQQKLKDLADVRRGGGMGLVAYDGSAHLVMPVTSDARVVYEVAESIEPSIMPVEGDALADAIDLASKQLRGARGSGSILVITDSVAADQAAALRVPPRDERRAVQLLAAVGDRETAEDGGIFAAAEALGAHVELVTVDRSDVESIGRGAESLARAASDTGARRRDDGYLLVPLILLGLLPWSRRGWSLRWD